tara:strand:+ start:6108 stop:6611 length:504 start_codon:yes stop_codon:yes gene_type:complete
VSIDTTLQTIYDLPMSASIRENVNAFPLLESLHVVALAVVFGTIMIVDLRLIGVASHRREASRLIREFLPYTWVAFMLAVVTGLGMFMSNALSYAANTYFLLKMVALMVAGLNMAWFHSTAYRRISEWDETMPPPAAARFAGFTSLFTWMVVIFLGRWIGFTLEMVW